MKILTMERYSIDWTESCPREILMQNVIYVYHYGDDVRLQFGDRGPAIGMKEKDVPAKIKYAIASRGLKDLWKSVRPQTVAPTVAVIFETKEFNELAASVSLMLVPGR